MLKITEYLRYGKENAISSKDLANLAGVSSVRELQKIIERERQAGAVILSTCADSGGYYLSNDPTEIKAFVRTLSNRAHHTMMSLASAESALAELTGQQRLEGM